MNTPSVRPGSCFSEAWKGEEKRTHLVARIWGLNNQAINWFAPNIRFWHIQLDAQNSSAMTDHQKIHPADVEAAPSAPLVKHDSLNPTGPGSPVRQFPPHQRTMPVRYSKPPKKRSCCCRCFCWTVSLLLILLILIAATVGILYLVFRPKLPKYSVDRLRISNLQLNSDNSLSAALNVTITARNPNKNIGIYYRGGGSHLSVWYGNTSLCDGALPEFYQGHRNTTVLTVALAGRTQFGSTLMNALVEQQQTGSIPLDLKVRVPVRVKFGRLKLRKVKFLVRCRLVVGNLTAGDNTVSIRNSSCKFKLRLWDLVFICSFWLGFWVCFYLLADHYISIFFLHLKENGASVYIFALHFIYTG